MGTCRASRRRLAIPLLVAGLAAAALGGCSGTLVARMGPLPGQEALATLVVTDDLAVVRDRCAGTAAPGRVLGCQSSRVVVVPGGGFGRAVTIVRYADVLPSAMTFEIDAHELCHAVAALQGLDDPCHAGNGGVVQSMEQVATTWR
jgi:hypothetical protein